VVNKVKAKAKSAHPVTPSAVSAAQEVAAVVVNALSKLRPLSPMTATSPATTDVRKDAPKGAMLAQSAIVALMKTATTPRWSKTPQPLSVLTPS
jgi:hypothetical protein